MPSANQNSEISYEELKLLPDIPPSQRKLSKHEQIEVKRKIQEARETEKARINKIIFQDRDMSLYARKDTSDCDNYRCKQTALRNSIWNFWNNQKRGYIEDRLQGIDLRVTDYVFVEPNEEGKWIIIWKTVTDHSMDELDKITEFVGTISNKKLNENNRKLVFKDNEGKTIKEL